jgi:DNA-binding CsgD family transcriptional regulator
MANISHLGLTIHGQPIINDLESIGITDHDIFLKILKKLEKYIKVEGDNWIWIGSTRRSLAFLYLPKTLIRVSVNKIIYILFVSDGTPKSQLSFKDKNNPSIYPNNLIIRTNFANHQKIPPEGYKDILSLFDEGKTRKEIAQIYSVSYSSIAGILNYKANKTFDVESITGLPQLTEVDAENIRTLYSQGKTQKEIADLYGRHNSTISQIVNNKRHSK